MYIKRNKKCTNGAYQGREENHEKSQTQKSSTDLYFPHGGTTD